MAAGRSASTAGVMLEQQKQLMVQHKEVEPLSLVDQESNSCVSVGIVWACC